ncbi:hypothetical protein [Oligosphaera ethanolica]|uniref:Uncharacterized protein n=1 Tax=Oligosphaera ethanolica TaxID=760260 RepID=A0AAE4AN42_9BACT|nr:hypothetical protein [Oligosphaera ethanolica]MDQ0289211.1 hypothetical protein [Oligosphaera ethanolica]
MSHAKPRSRDEDKGKEDGGMSCRFAAIHAAASSRNGHKGAILTVPIAVDCRRLPSIAVDCRRLPSIAVDCRRLPSIAVDCRRLPSIAVDCRRLPVDCRRLPVDCRRLPSIACRLPSIAIDCQEAPPVPGVPSNWLLSMGDRLPRQVIIPHGFARPLG